MPRNRTELKELLQELDAVLHDNSIATQTFQKKVLDLVHQPQQRIVYTEQLPDGSDQIPDGFEAMLNSFLREMERLPQADNVEPHFNGQSLNWSAPTLVRPDTSEDFPDDYYDDYFTPRHYVVVDGVLYLCEYIDASAAHFAQEKDMPQWTIQTNSTGFYAQLDQSGIMIDIPLDVSTVRCPLNEPLFPTSLTSRFRSVTEVIESFQNLADLGEFSPKK